MNGNSIDDVGTRLYLAVGGFVAARLAGAGHHVTVLALPRSAARLREGGLRIASQDGTSVRARAAGTATPLIDLAVLALRIHNRQIGS